MPALQSDIPGPRSTALVDILARHESPGITRRRARAQEARGLAADPIVWERALGANVWDADGNRFVDLSAGFGVALIGHGHPRVVTALREQSERLIHGMGDVFPNRPRILLMQRLAEMAPGDLSQCILGTGGAESVEIALKTARLKTGRSGVLAFWGAYHGLSYGALAATAYKDAFRRPFRGQMGGHVVHMPYGESIQTLDQLLTGPATAGEEIGAILVEPILGRGGQVVPPDDWLRGLRSLADSHGCCLIFDEIYTGLGRTGRWWAGDHVGVVPDILCVGKALGGGMPISACVATEAVMAAWSTGAQEAIHTSTFLGHPMAAAAALASLEVLQAIDAPAKARAFESRVRGRFGGRVQGRGAMLGVRADSGAIAARVAGRMLEMGYILLPNGVAGDILSLTPPLALTEAQAEGALDGLEALLEAEGVDLRDA